MEIRQKHFTPRILPFKVTGGYSNQHGRSATQERRSWRLEASRVL